jgi:hypothetical protein
MLGLCQRRGLRLTVIVCGVALALVLAVDPFGGVSHAAAFAWRLDALLTGSSGPVTVAAGAKEGSWLDHAATVTLTASDDAAGSGVASITYVLDGVSRTVAGSRTCVTVAAAPNATHVLVYHAVDKAGTTGKTRSLTLHVDTVAPAIATRRAKGSRSGAIALMYRIVDASRKATDVTVVIHDSRGKVQKRFSVGGQSVNSWHCVRWKPFAPGIYTYAVSAVDLAGNRGVSSAGANIVVKWPVWLVIGHSVLHRQIRVAQFGVGSRRLLVIGGVHPMEAGTSVATKFAAYLAAHPKAVPTGWQIDVITCLDPDGLAHGWRGNADNVDLNRNFPTLDWRRTLQTGDPSRSCGLSGGRRVGSEPETKALMAYLRKGFRAVLSLHSDAGILDCHGPGGHALGKRMAVLSGIPVGSLSYQDIVTGSLEAYVAEHYRIPTIMVELQTTTLGRGLRLALLTACR